MSQQTSQNVLPIASITPPKHRLRSDIGDLEDMKASMKERGLIYPILVRKAVTTVHKGNARGLRTWIPAAVRADLDLQAGDRICWAMNGFHEVIITKVKA